MLTNTRNWNFCRFPLCRDYYQVSPDPDVVFISLIEQNRTMKGVVFDAGHFNQKVSTKKFVLSLIIGKQKNSRKKVVF